MEKNDLDLDLTSDSDDDVIETNDIYDENGNLLNTNNLEDTIVIDE